MPAKTAEPSKTLIQKHLDRARDLGVDLPEYAEAYNVDLKELQAANSPSLLSDFVAVKIDTPPKPSHHCLCSLVSPSGARLEFHEWPPTAVLSDIWRHAQ